MRTLLFMAIAIEAHRFLSAWWMRRARESDKYPKRVPFLDMMFAPTSPLVAARQYSSTLLCSDGGQDRLQIVWIYQEYSSYAEWCAHQPAQVRELRRMILVVESGLYRRHVAMLKHLTWRLPMLIDPRVNEFQKLALMQEWDDTDACCMPPGLGRQLKLIGVTARMLRNDPLWQMFLAQLARLISQQVCDLEWRRARNRGRSDKDGKTKFDLFAAEAVCSEARLQHQNLGLIHDRNCGCQPPATPRKRRGAPKEPDSHEKLPKVLIRAQTAEELHRKAWVAQQKELGLSCNAAKSETWAAWRDSYNALEENQLSSYAYRAELSKRTAKANRASRAQQSQAAPRPSLQGHDPRPPLGEQHLEPGRPLQLRDGWPNTFVTIGAFQHRVHGDTLESFCQATSFAKEMLYPLSLQSLQAHGSYKKATTSFKSQCRFAERDPRDAFPASVCYPPVCRKLCVASSSDAERVMYRVLLDAFGQCAARFGVGRAIACADVILAVDVFASPDDPALTLYFDFRQAQGGFGIAKAGQTFHRLAPVHEAPGAGEHVGGHLAGLVLQYTFGDFTLPDKAPRAPISRARVGPLNSFTEDELAVHLMHHTLPGVGGLACVPSKVLIRQLDYDDIDLRHVKVTGILGSFAPIVAELGVVKAKKADKKNNKKGDVAPGDLLNKLELKQISAM